MAYGENKKYVFGIVFGLVAILFISKLYKLQIKEKSYYFEALQNTSDKITVYPSRGIIYDRNGKLLAYNDAVHNLIVIPHLVDENLDTISLCRILDIDIQEFERRMAKAKKLSKLRKKDNSFNRTALFLNALSKQSLSQLQEEIFKYKGFYLEIKSDRKYKTRSAAHVLGYINEVSPRDLDKDPYYGPGDLIGVNGIEKSYESFLRGKKGVRNILVDNLSNEIGALEGGVYDTAAISGSDLFSSLDIELQMLGEKLLAGKRGSIVAIEPSTGEILALVNNPTYDPSLLVGKDRGANFAKLSKDPEKPFLNRAILGRYPPGSTFKTIMALIGSEEQVCNINTRYPCHGGYHLGSLTIGCHPHPSGLNLHQSIQQSCNAWYCQLFRNIVDNKKYPNVSEGYENWVDHLSHFGIGVKLGIDLPSEGNGFIPPPSYYDGIYGQGRWRSSTILSIAIGQGEVQLTPMQMANMAAIIANKGYYYIPHSISRIGADGKVPEKYRKKHKTRVSRKYYDDIIIGMSMVFGPGGTARSSRVDSIAMCGKTGTAQNPHGKDHSVFIAFAPQDNPQIAISVIVENGGYGGTFAAPIAALMMERYLEGDEYYPSRPDLLKRMTDAVLIKKHEQ
jgi:penicillin-binding protein 2